MRTKLGWTAVLVVALVGGAMLAWQHLETTSLREEFAALGKQQGDLARLRAENVRLRAVQVSATELERLRGDHNAVARLRGEIATLRSQADAKAKAAPEPKPALARFATGSTIPASEWKNAGRASPAAALETVLWAAAGGDVDAFASMLMIETSKTLPAARALLATLPDAMRATYGTPEKLIAFLAIKDVPLGSASVRQWTNNAANQNSADRVAQTLLVLSAPDGNAKHVNLMFVRQDEGWKLAVMEGVVAKYAAQLKGDAAAAK